MECLERLSRIGGPLEGFLLEYLGEQLGEGTKPMDEFAVVAFKSQKP